MKLLLTLLLLGSNSASLALRSERSAPYILPRNAPLIPDQYVVMLQDNHTIEDHFLNIGLNLSKVSQMFFPMNLINAYRCRLQSSIIHSLVRRDPGVKHVEHDHYIDWHRPQISDKLLNIEDPPANKSLSGRWEKVHISNAYWFQGQISAGKRLPLPISEAAPYDVIRGAGDGVNVYVLDTGIRTTHWGFFGNQQVRNFKGLNNSDMSPYCDEAMVSLTVLITIYQAKVS